MLPPGTTIKGRYVLESPLGDGGVGTVYRARDRLTDHAVAVKLVHPEVLSRHPGLGERFMGTARAVLRLSHPNMVRVFDVGDGSDGTPPCLVMEWLDGTPMRALLDKLDKVQLLRLLDQVIDALAAAHEQGVVHRDLKPENVMVLESPAGLVAKVLDFDFAKLTGPERAKLTMTSTGGFGTPYYMSPEQSRSAAHVDARTDVFSLGAMLYEILTDEPPPLKGAPPSPRGRCPECVPALEALVMACLSDDPAGRPADAGALRAALAATAPHFTRPPVRVPKAHVTEAVHAHFGYAPTTPPLPVASGTPMPGPAAALPRPTAFTPIGNLPARTPIRTDPGAGGSKTKLLIAGLGAIALVGAGGAGAYFALHRESAPATAAAAVGAPAIAAAPGTVEVQVPTSLGMPLELLLDGQARPESVPALAADAATPRIVALPGIAAGAHVVEVRARGGGEALSRASVTVNGGTARATLPERCPAGSLLVPGHGGVASYCLDRTEVSTAAYSRCVDTDVCALPGSTVNWEGITTGDRETYGPYCNGPRDAFAQHPVNCVTWSMASTYCAHVGGRLPSEPEWELAGRGAEGRLYPWGSEPPSITRLNACDSNCQTANPHFRTLYTDSDGFETTSPVGHYPAGAGPYGHLDLAGNVHEWLAYGAGAAAPEGDATVPVRGGAWDLNDPLYAQPGHEEKSAAGIQDALIGFRCAHAALPLP